MMIGLMLFENAGKVNWSNMQEASTGFFNDGLYPVYLFDFEWSYCGICNFFIIDIYY
jgi:hypothetical protein